MNPLMIPVHLTRVKTRDGVLLDGIASLPRGTWDTALVWVHGLGSRFSRGQTLIKELSSRCAAERIAYFKYNTRGHDIVNRDAAGKDALAGAGFERFADCRADIDAMISSARRAGAEKIILAGHSTGANKSLYYMHKTRNRRVKGLILLGPVSDIVAGRKKFGAAALARGVAIARRRARADRAALMPRPYGIISAARFLSMFCAGGAEDVFPYTDPAAAWAELRGIRVPLAVVIGGRDEYLDRPARQLVEVFRANAGWTKSFSGAIIKGADHGFRRKERELAVAIVAFAKRAVV